MAWRVCGGLLNKSLGDNDVLALKADGECWLICMRLDDYLEDRIKLED